MKISQHSLENKKKSNQNIYIVKLFIVDTFQKCPKRVHYRVLELIIPTVGSFKERAQSMIKV